MRALAKVLAVTVCATFTGLTGAAVAQEACAPADLDRFAAAAMVADADLRQDAEAALAACARFALAQQRSVGEIEERVLAQVAALAGRTSYATYAADEIPKASPEFIALLAAAFRPLYPHLRALSEEENTAAMRTIVFHLLQQANPTSTGSVPGSGAASPTSSPSGARP